VSRFNVADAVRMLVVWLTSTFALWLAVELLPGLTADGPWPLLACTLVAGLVGVVVRPLMAELAAAVGWLAVALVAVVGQAVTTYVAMVLVPGISTTSFWSALAAAWLVAGVGTFLSWLTATATPESFTTSLLRSGRRHGPVPDPDVEGVLFVQLDGVPFEVMQWALQSGTMPTLRRWIDSGTHRLHEWRVQMPCTTPASQLGILHGSCAHVPAFRWWDRDLQRLLVANRPADARVIEDRVTNGRGLLADDGVSVSNLFSGDAPRSSMTMSRLELSRGSRETRRAFAWFMVRPDGLARALARTVAELGRERFQSVRQRRRQVQPRVHRSWTFAALRAFSNGLLRDLNTAVVADEMLKGTRAIYVDYVDYDEVAHHAGGLRIESLAALADLDEVLAVMERLAVAAPRRYRIVVLSDHGQVQGNPFSERFDVDLSGLCARLASEQVAAVEENVESWGRVGSLAGDLGTSGGPTSQAAGRVSRRVDRHTTGSPGEQGEEAAPLVVVGSGNLGLVYVKGQERLTLEQLHERWPALVPGLASHPGIGFIAVTSDEHGPLAIGAQGRRALATGQVEGVDPLAPFGAHAPGMLAAAMASPQAPDIYVNSMLDPETLEVAAFEDLVGSHGGFGGWQDHGMLVAPADLLAATPPIVGAEDLHRRLVGMLETLGHRRPVAGAEGPVQVGVPAQRTPAAEQTPEEQAQQAAQQQAQQQAQP
jgi:uncharacterized membrane protein YvlD (DUF360 family)